MEGFYNSVCIGKRNHCYYLYIYRDSASVESTRGGSLTLAPIEIEFQPGDVVGYYVDHFKDGRDETDGGIQWISSTAVTVYYTDDIPRVGIKTQYALDINPTACGFQVSSTGNSHLLIQSVISAPIISLSFSESMHSQSTHTLSDQYLFACAATVMLISTVAPLLTSTSPPPEPVVTSTPTSPPPGPAVPPPATPPSVSQNDNTAIIVGSVLAIAIVAIGKLFYSPLLEPEHMKSPLLEFEHMKS